MHDRISGKKKRRKDIGKKYGLKIQAKNDKEFRDLNSWYREPSYNYTIKIPTEPSPQSENTERSSEGVTLCVGESLRLRGDFSPDSGSQNTLRWKVAGIPV